jgi:hypothetical protein
MIKQFGPPTFFETFIISVNNWSILMKTLKDLHTKHFQQNVKIFFNDSLADKDFVKNGPKLHYVIHRMNCLHKLLKKTNILFGEVQDYVFITKFQFEGLAHDHGLIWVKDVFQFGISMNEEIDKYLTIDQTILPNNIHNA